MILVDTSAWVAFLRRKRPLDLEARVEVDRIVTCLPVAQEVLQGIREDDDFLSLRDALLAFPVVESPLSEGVFLEAVDLYRRARRRGLTVRSGVDCLVAAIAIRHELEVVHVDRDYECLARMSDLRQRRLG